MKIRVLKSLCRLFAGTTLLFSGFVGIGTSLVLLASSCAGYLPYSDRPGPGWWGRVHWPSWAEFVNYFGFAPWFAYFCLYFGVGLFALSLVLGFASTPKWLNRIIGGVIAAAAAGLAVAGAGWYIALSEIGPDAAIVLGLIYGVFLFPFFVKPSSRPIPMWIRASVVTCCSTLLVYWIVSPLLPKEPVPNIHYEVMRVTSGNKVITPSPSQGYEVAHELSALELKGITHGGIAGGVNSGSDSPNIDVELVALEPIKQKARLAIPKTGFVVYVLKGGSWSAYPPVLKKDKRTITIEPGTDAKYESVQFGLGKQPAFAKFTWYPVITKPQY